MAAISVKIYKEEKDKMLQVIKKNKGKTISVAKLAEQAGFNPNRSRFIIAELLDEGKVVKIPTKQFNERYVRYTYECR
jgi:predicted HTH transcriptional regulator